jgi:formyltetrahydrofolate deformylase
MAGAHVKREHSTPAMSDWILTLSCPNRPGIVAAVTARLAAEQGDISEAAQFDDPHTRQFFMRVMFRQDGDIERVRRALAEESLRFGMSWQLRAADLRRKVLILVSGSAHCLGDLLYRARTGDLPMDCVGVVSNHPQAALKVLLDEHIPFHHLPVTAETKMEQEAHLQQLIETSGAELVVLARYMQILSDPFSSWLKGRCINIHHSFLPGFKGAKPYHQAYERGVKMIGATAHYVTGDLDEGPIIAQDVEYISHADTPQEMIRKGRDIERRVLARAVTWHLEDRVLLNGNKTVVFQR